jgi:hypothetical protein
VGVVSTSVKQRVTTTPKDLPYGEGEIRVVRAQGSVALPGTLVRSFELH